MMSGGSLQRAHRGWRGGQCRSPGGGESGGRGVGGGLWVMKDPCALWAPPHPPWKEATWPPRDALRGAPMHALCFKPLSSPQPETHPSPFHPASGFLLGTFPTTGPVPTSVPTAPGAHQPGRSPRAEVTSHSSVRLPSTWETLAHAQRINEAASFLSHSPRAAVAWPHRSKQEGDEALQPGVGTGFPCPCQGRSHTCRGTDWHPGFYLFPNQHQDPGGASPRGHG